MMCRNHDQQHYSPLMRQAATSAAMGDDVTRDLLLQVWTYHGLLDWMDRYGDEASSLRQDVIRACIRKEHSGLKTSYNGMIENLLNRWQEELTGDVDSVPY